MTRWDLIDNAETGRRRDAGLIDEGVLENRITSSILDAAIEVHRHLGGPGLLESIYEDAFVYELKARNISFKRQVLVPVLYKGEALRDPLRLDVLVDDRVVVEVKATESQQKVNAAQVLTYLRLTQCKIGLVINFGLPLLKDGVIRVVNHL